MVTQSQRFQRKVNISENGCWHWVGSKYPNGYGRFYDEKNHGVRAHRWAYEAWVGPISEGLTVDHKCHDPLTCNDGVNCSHRKCVNPEHMNLVSIQDNLKRRSSVVVTHCPQGHEYTIENTYTHGGTRTCKTCNNQRSLDRYYKRKLSEV